MSEIPKDLTFEDVDALLKSDPETGKLFWKERPASMFKSERDAKAWNTRYAGKEAFTATNCQGYMSGTMLRRGYVSHRVIWLLANGKWPDCQIDHINGIRSDNRLVNLRDVPQAENGKNQRPRIDNTSGVSGVYWSKNDCKWNARIRVAGQQIHLGYFEDFDAAVSARKLAELENGFHPNHGSKTCLH